MAGTAYAPPASLLRPRVSQWDRCAFSKSLRGLHPAPYIKAFGLSRHLAKGPPFRCLLVAKDLLACQCRSPPFPVILSSGPPPNMFTTALLSLLGLVGLSSVSPAHAAAMANPFAWSTECEIRNSPLEVSCHNTTVQDNTCCFESPGVSRTHPVSSI